MSQTRQRGFVDLLFPTSDEVLDRLDFASMRLRLVGCLHAHTRYLQNKAFAVYILLWSFHSFMTNLFVDTIVWWNVFASRM